jgi:pyrimidine operon attenuation protein/uracil phosphoribosyltransferase
VSLVPPFEQELLDRGGIERIVRRMASAIAEATWGTRDLSLVGIRRGGVPLARMLARELARLDGREVPVGTVDISLYRDDAATALPDPKIGPSDVPFSVSGKHVVLVDDVLQTGRTVRAAIDCLQDYGRPSRIWLAVLCDRGGRELPIAADFVGRELQIPSHARLDVVSDEEGPFSMTLRVSEADAHGKGEGR